MEAIWWRSIWMLLNSRELSWRSTAGSLLDRIGLRSYTSIAWRWRILERTSSSSSSWVFARCKWLDRATAIVDRLVAPLAVVFDLFVHIRPNTVAIRAFRRMCSCLSSLVSPGFVSVEFRSTSGMSRCLCITLVGRVEMSASRMFGKIRLWIGASLRLYIFMRFIQYNYYIFEYKLLKNWLF